MISTFETGSLDGYLGGYDTPNYTVAFSNQYATDGNSSLQITDVTGHFNVGGMIYLQNSGPTAAKFNEFAQSTTVLYDMTWMPGTSGYALSQAGLKRSTGCVHPQRRESAAAAGLCVSDGRQPDQHDHRADHADVHLRLRLGRF